MNRSLSKLVYFSKKQLVGRVRKTNKRITYLKNRNRILNKTCRKLIHKEGHNLSKKDSEMFPEIINANMDSEDKFSRIFLKQQLEASKHDNKRARCWYPKIIKWCLLMHSKSPGAYECLRKTGALELPCQKTLYRYSLPLTAKPGFSSSDIVLLKQQMLELKVFDQEHTKYVALLIDEMKILENLIYRRTTGDLTGFVDLGHTLNELKQLDKRTNEKKQNKLDLATNVLQFMVKGITSNLKFSFAFFPCNKMNFFELSSLVKVAIQRLESIDCRVLVVIGDGASTNRKFFESFLSNFETTQRSAEQGCMNYLAREGDRPLYFIFDPPHLVKTARNCLESSAIDSKTRILKKNGKHMFWSHITQLYYKDCQRIPRRYPKLKFKHIKLGSFAKMSVKIAAQVLSRTIALGLEEEMGEEATKTAEFIHLMNRFFDMMNCSNFTQPKHRRNQDLRPFCSPGDKRLTWLEKDFLKYFEDWEEEVFNLPDDLTQSKRKMMLLSKETSQGLKITALSIVGVIRFMLNKGAKYVLTRKLNQDSIEQEFGKHRSLCGSNSNPTAFQYQQSVGKIRCLKGLIPIVTGGNTETVDESVM